jgi:hypothetical protein
VAVLYGAPLRAEAGGGAGHKEQVRDLTSRLQAALEELQRQAFDWMPLKGRSAPDARRGAGNDGPAPASSPAPAAEGTRQAAASGAEGH